MMGTARPNLFYRLGMAWDAIKGVSLSPGELYPPNQRNSGQSTSWINWRSWPEFEREAQTEGQKDLLRAKTAVTSPWVFADVQAIANEFSTSELIVKERRGDKLEDVDNHPLELIWESPNEHMGRSFVTAFWAWSYVLASKSYLYWVPDTSGIELMEVWPVPPWMITPIPDKDEFIRGYAFKANQYADTIVIPPELITYSHSVNLFNVRDGLSFLAAADTEIRADLAASLWNLNFFDDNNGVPDGFIALAADTLDQDIERVRMELKDFFGGTKRGVAVGRSSDLKWQEFGRSQKDMEFGQGREFASKVIGRTLGFPDGYWSDLANRANAEQARRTMISGAVWPLLVRLAEDMNAARRGVVQRWYGESMRVEFKDIRPEDKEAQRAELAAYAPFITVNELRELVGQEALDKKDPRGLMLVAEITKGAPLPGTPAALLLEDLQAKKDEEAAQQQAALVEQGLAPNPNEPQPEEAPAPEGEAPAEAPPQEGEPPAPPEAAAGKAVDRWWQVAPVVMNTASNPSFEYGGSGWSHWTPLDITIEQDMERWERKAIKRFKATGKAAVGFESDVIDADEHERISAALKAAGDIPAIKAAFKRDAVDTLLDSVDDEARAWADEAMSDE